MRRARKRFKSEAELASGVVQWLTQNGWDVYQEVQFRGSVADIVAVFGKLVWIIECKQAFTLDVLCQAGEWLPYAHYVSVAVPYSNGRRHGTTMNRIMAMLNIGCLEVEPYNARRMREIMESEPI